MNTCMITSKIFLFLAHLILSRFLRCEKGEHGAPETTNINAFANFFLRVDFILLSLDWIRIHNFVIRMVLLLAWYISEILGDPEVTANIYCKSHDLNNTDTQNYSPDLR